jgi:hypothetical protein
LRILFCLPLVVEPVQQFYSFYKGLMKRELYVCNV